MNNTETLLYVDCLLKVLAWYLFPVNSVSKQKCAMHRCMKNPHILKVRRYAARLIDLNGCLASFPGATMSDNIGVTELNEKLLNSIPNRYSKQAYVQVFIVKLFPFKKL